MKCSAASNQSSKLKAQSSKNSKPVRIAWLLGNTLAIFAFFVTELCNASEPYCGVYCIQACRTVLQVDGDFETLLSNKYVIGFDGSSLESLKTAADDCGLASMRLHSLSITDLRLASVPIILHVRSDRVGARYDHWVLFLGQSPSGRAIIYDPSHGRLEMEYSDLLATWDGAGLSVSSTYFPLWIHRFLSFSIRLLAFVAVGFACILIIRVLNRYAAIFGSQVRSDAVVATGMISFLGLVGITLDIIGGNKVLANAVAARTIHATYTAREFPEVTTVDLLRQLDNQNPERMPVLIDARFQDDFRYAHIPGAISIPVDCSVVSEREVVSLIPKTSQLVVYCQSKGCLFSDQVAKRLEAMGYSSISIFRDGYVGWKEASLEQRETIIAE